MNILHIYSPGDRMQANYVDLLLHHASDDLHVEAMTDAKEFRKRCKTNPPDVVHQHDCLDPSIARCIDYAYKKGIRIVLTPHGQLEPWEVKRSVFMTNPFIRRNIRHTYAITVMGKMEADTMKGLGWNNRIEIIRNPIVTKTTSPQQLALQMYTIYKKTVDSQSLTQFDDKERDFLRLALKAGITGDKRWITEPLQEPTSWKALSIYVYNEGVSSVFQKGLQVLGINAPSYTTADLKSYLPNDYKLPIPIKANSIVELTSAINNNIAERQLPLIHLVQLDEKLRYGLVEDDHLTDTLIDDGQFELFASLMQLLSEYTGLDEGFMPCKPQDGKLTKRMRNIVERHLQI